MTDEENKQFQELMSRMVSQATKATAIHQIGEALQLIKQAVDLLAETARWLGTGEQDQDDREGTN